MEYVKVKILGSDGKVKGREYTYSTDFEVCEGDIVIADMAGSDKQLVVTETGITLEQLGKLDYELKQLKGFNGLVAVEETVPIGNLDFKVEKEILPVIKINFEELKANLIETMEYYKNIQVTEENLKESKGKQKELASTRESIDKFRLAEKKILKKPIDVFEEQCQELIELVKKTEIPIKDGITIFDNLKKDEKRITALRLITEVIEEQHLNEKYGARLDVTKEYCNLTVKEKDVKDDLTARAMTLKVEQDREEELIDIIKDAIESENEKINRKIKFGDFKRYIDRGMSTKDVIAEIKLSANRIYEAENPPIIEEPEPIPEVIPEPVQAPIREPIQETVQMSEPIIEVVPEPIPFKREEDVTFYAVYRIFGKLEQLRSVSKFLKDNEINYNVTDQGEI